MSTNRSLNERAEALKESFLLCPPGLKAYRVPTSFLMTYVVVIARSLSAAKAQPALTKEGKQSAHVAARAQEERADCFAALAIAACADCFVALLSVALLAMTPALISCSFAKDQTTRCGYTVGLNAGATN